MKELSIEEKARAYDEAIKYAHYLINERCKENTDGSFHRADLNKMFPELAESEDEKIRKELIEQVIYIVPNSDEVDSEGNVLPTYQKRIDKYRAWLEKQGKQKSIDNMTQQEAMDIAVAKCFNERKPTDKIEPKFKVGDIIKPKDGGHEPWQIMQIDILDKKYRFKKGYVIHFSQEDDYELVERKPAWSEEDEKMLDGIIEASTHHCYLNITDIEWLKSLKERYTWKPSDEQMEYLAKAIATLGDEGDCKTASILNYLRVDLKKLRKNKL